MMTTQTILPREITAYIDECLSRDHSESHLIAVLQKVQNHFGYLPRESMDEVSQQMQIPAARVTGVATFYHFFTFSPKGEFRITVCMGTACYVRGAQRVLDRFEELLNIRSGQTSADGRFSIESARCIGACALAPIVMVNDKVYGNVTPEDVERILKEYGFGKKDAKKRKKGGENHE